MKSDRKCSLALRNAAAIVGVRPLGSQPQQELEAVPYFTRGVVHEHCGLGVMIDALL